MQDWHRIAAAAEFAENGMRAFVIAGRDIVVGRSREGWFALDDLCTHGYARMSEGRLRGCRLICPLHGASFDVRDGRVLGAPATAALGTHGVRVLDEFVEVCLGSGAQVPGTPLAGS
jgi:nitrite reductase/ring-hydroxylating ferredoxin subunit